MGRVRTIRCCAFGMVVLAVVGWGAGVANAGMMLPTATFADDASCGIDGFSITYTHALDFGNVGAAPTINSLVFTKAGPTGFDWNTTFSGGVLYAAGATGSIGVPPGQGTYDLLNDFLYNGNPGTLTITGLTPGTWYEARLYYRNWGSPRFNNVTFDEGTGAAQTLSNYNQDADSSAHYLRYWYAAGASGALTITNTVVPGIPNNGTWHWYGFSNQVSSAPPMWISASNTDWGTAGNWNTGVVPDGQGTFATFGSAGTTGTVNLGAAGRTVGTLNLLSSVSTTIGSTGGNTLTLDNSLSSAGISAAGTHVITAGVVLASNAAISVAGGGDRLTLSGPVSGGMGLIMSGRGTLVLSNTANSYSGGTTLTSGTLAITSDANLGNSFGGITFNGGALKTAAVINSARNVTTSAGTTSTFDSNGYDSNLSGTVTGAGNLTKTGGGTIALSGFDNSGFTGFTTINAGAVRLDSAGALSGSTVSVNAPNGLTFGAGITAATIGGLGGNRGFTLATAETTPQPVALSVGASGAAATFTGSMSGGGSLLKVGGGQLLLASANSYTGGTAINAGSLRIGNAGALGSGDVSIANGANLLLWWNAGSTTIANNFVLNGPGGVDGKDAIYGDGAIVSGGSPEYTLSGGIRLDADSNIGGNDYNHVRITGKITGAGGLTKGGARADENNILTLANPANDYAGNTTITKGTLRLGTDNAIPFGAGKGNLAVNAALDLSGHNQTVNGLSGAGTITNRGAVAGTKTLTIGAGDAAATFGGTIENGMGLALKKTGAGSVTLSGKNTYLGPTIIEAGTLKMPPSVVIPTNPVAHWAFDGNANDDSGNGLNGTLGAGVNSATGVIGGALSFPNTTAGHVTVPYNSALSLNTFTVSAWVNVNSKAAPYGILGTRVGGECTFDYKVMPGYIHGDIGDGNAWITTAMDIPAGGTPDSNIAAGAWHMVTYVVDNSAKQFALYLDGTLKNTIGFAGTPLLMKSGQSLFIGDDYTYEPFNGLIDDVYIYGRALSTADVNSLYQLSQGGVPAPQGIPLLSAVTVNAGATLDMDGTVMGIGSLSGGGSVLLGASGALTTGGDNTSTTFSGVISSTGGSLTKTGSGTMTLTGANTYNGPTTVNGGTLVLSGASGSLPNSSAYNIGPGTLRLDNSAANNNTRLKASGLTLTGGTLELIGNGPATDETFGAVTLKMGDSRLVFGGPGAIARATLPSPGVGSTLNIVGSDDNHKLILTGQANGFMGARYFAGGSDFAWYDGGKVRPINYGTDTNSVVNDGTVAIVNGKYTKLTGYRLNDDGATIYSLNLAGSGAGVELQEWTTLKVTTGALIKSGGGSAGKIAGVPGGDSTSITLTASSPELIVRTDTAADLLTISVPISGATMTLVKSGAGTLALTNGSSAYSATAIDGGVLSFSSGALPLGTNKISFAGGALQWATGNSQDISASIASVGAGFSAILDTNGNNVTLANSVAGSGGLSKLGAGTLALSVANTFSGPVAINGGTLSFANGALPGGANKIIFGGGTLQWAAGNSQGFSGSIAPIPAGVSAILDTNGNNITISGPLSGGGSLVKSGAGALILADDSTYAGATTINAGTLQFGNGGAGGQFLSNVTNNGILAFNRSVDFEVSNTISGTGAVVQVGSRMLTLSGTNTYSGGTMLAGGALSIASNANIGGPSARMVFFGGMGGDANKVAQGAVLQVTGTAITNLDTHPVNWDTFNGGFDIADPNNTFTVSQNIGGPGGLTKYGPGTLVLSGNNTFAARTKIYAGTLRITSSSGLGAGGHDANTMSEINDGAALELAGNAISPEHFHFWGVGPAGNGAIRSLSGDNALTNGPGYCIRSDSRIGVDSGTLRITQLYEQGVSVQMEKVGAGTLIFDGEPTNGGWARTLISAGTLQIGNAGTTGSLRAGSPVVNNATLAFNRSNEMIFSSDIGGSGVVKQIGTGITGLSGVNTYTGGTDINNGVLRFDSASAIPATGLIHANSGGTAASSPTLLGALLAKIDTASQGAVALTADSIANVNLSTFDSLSLGAVGNVSFTHNYTPKGTTYRLGGGGGILNYASNISGASSLVVCGGGLGGAVVLTGTNNFSGTTTIAGGALRGPSGLSANSHVVINGGAFEYVGGGTITSLLLGSGPSQAEIPGGASGISAFGGALNIDLGATLVWGAGYFKPNAFILNQPTADSPIALLSALDLNGATRTINVNSAAAYPATISGVISGTGAAGFTKGGPGTLVLGSANTYGGPTTVSAGTLVAAVGGAIPSGTGKGNVAINTGATLDLAGSDLPINGLSGAGTVTNSADFMANILTVGNANAAGNFSGVIANGAGALALVKVGAGTQALSGVNTYGGGTTISGGVLSINADSALGAVPSLASTNLSFTGSGGTLQAAGPVVLSPARGISIDSGATATFDTQANAVTIHGVVAGDGGLKKTGTGTLTLPAANTYTGPTMIESGTLRVIGAPAGAIAHYGFDDGTAKDDISALNGAVTPLVTATGGKIGGALNFPDSGTQHVSVPYSPLLNLSSFTVSAWVNVADRDTVQGILGTRVGGECTFDVKVMPPVWPGAPALGNTVHGDVGNGTAWISTSVDFAADMTALAPGTWHMVTYAIDPAVGQFRMYLDGALQNTMSFAGTPQLMKPGEILFIGDTYSGDLGWSGTEPMKGSIDDVFVFGSALSDAEVANLYQRASGGGASQGIPSGSAVTIKNGATLDMTGAALAIGSLAGDAGSKVLLEGGKLTVGNDGPLAVFSGAISGAGGSLVKEGTSTLRLAGTDTYTGGTTVNAGTLQIASAGALPAGGSLSIAAGGTVVLSSGLSAAAGAGGHASASPVPEPGTLGLLLAAAAGLLAAAWRRKGW